MQEEKIGVLLMAYGSPDSLNDVEAYFTEIRSGHKPKPEEVKELRERYKRIGGRSPLLEITKQQGVALESSLEAQGVNSRVYIGMKHWYPFIEDAVKSMLDDGIRRVVAVVLAPHYSKMGIGGYMEALITAKSKLNATLSISFVEGWGENPLFLRAWLERIETALTRFQPSVKDLFVVFTAHSLPESVMQPNDPYPTQLQESCRRVAEMANLSRWTFAYQSAGLRKEKWLGPDILEKLRELVGLGHHNVLVVPIGFVSDHLEILYDIDVECQEFARANDISLLRTEMLNTLPTLIAALTSIVREHLSKGFSVTETKNVIF